MTDSTSKNDAQIVFDYKNLKTLKKFISFDQSRNELENRLEQLRAMENGMSIHVGYINSSPLSVDTEKDLFLIKKLMEKNE